MKYTYKFILQKNRNDYSFLIFFYIEVIYKL